MHTSLSIVNRRGGGVGLAGQTKTQAYLSEAFNVHFIEEEVLQYGSQLPPKLQLFTTYIKKCMYMLLYLWVD